MAKDKTQLDALIEPQSRSEEYLSKICGKANSSQQLPEPQSRMEEYLEYMAINGVIGGGQGVSTTANNVSFTDNNTSLGTDVQTAIENVNNKFANYVNKNNDVVNSGGTGNASKVVKLGQDGKLNKNMIPDLSINRVFKVSSKQDAINKIDSENMRVGDVVIITTGNDVYMYNGTKPTDENTFENGFIELTMADGVVKSINGTFANGTGEVDLSIIFNQDVQDYQIQLNLGNQTGYIDCVTNDDAQNIIDTIFI